MCKRRTELFIKLSSKYKVEKVEDVKELFIEGLKAVSEDSSESHKELSDKISELEKKMEESCKSTNERLSLIDDSLRQVIEHIVKPRGSILTFFSSKKFLIIVIIGLVLVMLSGIGFMGVLGQSSHISEIAQSFKK